MDADVLAELDANYVDSCRTFSGDSPGEYVERREVAIANSGVPVETLNFGYPKPPVRDLVATAETVRAYFAERGLPFTLRRRASQPLAGLDALEAAGWTDDGSPIPGMVLSPCDAGRAPDPPAGLVVREVRDLASLDAFRRTAFEGFGYPAAGARAFLNDRLLTTPQVRMYAGHAGDRVVSTSMLLVSGRVAGIYWVATLDGARGKGYGEALTWAAVEGGRQLGCSLASLQASQMGRPVYARMGFQHVLDYVGLRPPGAAPAA